MVDLLANFAALRAEFNTSDNDIVGQFMPLVGYAISNLKEPIVTEQELQKAIFDAVQFEMPRGAIRVMIARAARKPYAYITKNSDGTYSPNSVGLSKVTFRERLAAANTHQKQLARSFEKFCSTKLEVAWFV